MEVFKDIEGYEGLYQISNLGNVKSLNYRRSGEERILKPRVEGRIRTDGNRYLQVYLCKNGSPKNHKVHRLVAQAFLPNPDNLPQVNHKDENPSNNSVENLEWCTNEYNCNYGTHNERVAEKLRGRTCPWVAEACSISVDMLTKQGEFIRSFSSAMEAERWLRANGFPNADNGHINSCCIGREHYHTAYGFKWRYAQKKEATN